MFCDRPLILWNVGFFLKNLESWVIDIRFVHKLGEREAAVDKFNDKGSDVERL